MLVIEPLEASTLVKNYSIEDIGLGIVGKEGHQIG